MRTIQKQLLLIIVIGIVLATFISGATSLISFTSISKDRSNDILSKELELTASNLDDICINIEKTVATLGEYYTKEYPGAEALSGEEGKKYLESTKEIAKAVGVHNEYICAIYFRLNPELLGPKCGFFFSKTAVNSNLIEFDTTDLSKYDRDDLEHVAWFYVPQEAGTALWLDQYMNLNNGILTLTYAKPIYDKHGDFVGVVGIDIDTKQVYNQVSKTRIYDTGFAAMLSESGELKYSPQELYIEPEELIKITQSGKTEDISYFDQQKKMTVKAQKLRYGDYLLIVIEDEDLYASEQRVTLTIVLITLIVSLCIIAVMSGLLYRLFQHFKTDVMTKVGNRGSYMEEITDIESEMLSGHKVRYTLVIFDINGLKQVNDMLGHSAGDEMIKNAAEVIQKHFTQGTIYRVGGDEFVFLSREKNEMTIRYIFEKFQKEMNDNALNYDISKGDVIVSAGMASYDADLDACYEDTFKRADQEMYQNKALFYAVNKHLDRRK